MSEVCFGIDLGTSTCIISCIDQTNNPCDCLVNNKQYIESVVNVFFCEDNSVPEFRLQSPGIKENNSYHAVEMKRIIGRKVFESETSLQDNKGLDYKIVPDFSGNALARFRPSQLRVIDKYPGFYQDFSPRQIARELLSFLIANCSQMNSSKKAVITVPANFGNVERSETLLAAREAGIDVLQLLPEPTAAAIYYFRNGHITQDGIYMVFDFGGGTLDISVIKASKSGNSLSVIWIDGDNFLGGSDFDNILCENFLIPSLLKDGVDVKRVPKIEREKIKLAKIKRELQELSKSAKVSLCNKKTQWTGTIDVEDEEYIFNVKYEDYKSTCNNDKIHDRVLNVLNRVKKRMDESQWPLEKVLLAGGSSCIPFVEEWINEVFTNVELVKPMSSHSIVNIVSYGAAYFAKEITENSNINSIQQCLPKSIGVVT